MHSLTTYKVRKFVGYVSQMRSSIRFITVYTESVLYTNFAQFLAQRRRKSMTTDQWLDVK